ncbi:MAG: acyl-CoA dehydrogenase family protein [Syntrophaceae bacterium]|nr:acyl-CoA dehydrogenase family protein [Syntrophaceae bacterium]
MDNFNEEHKLVREMIQKLCRDKVVRRAAEVDKTEEYPWDLHQLFVENGLFNIRVSEKYGGAEMDYTSACIVVEELAKVDGACANTVAHHQAGMCCFMDGANEVQKEKYLPKIGRGDYLVGFAMTEPNSGSDAFSLKTRATMEGEEYVINGGKCFISNGGITDLYVLFTTVNPAQRREGITAFLVEKETPGLIVGKNENKMGFRASPTRELTFDNMRVPKENLLGKIGKGWELVLQSLTETRVLVAAMALGIAQGAMETAILYAKQREQFGQPIINFQGISFMLADMAIQVECARALIYKLAAMVDQGKRKLHYYASVAKCFASDMAMKVTTDAVQVLGGYGYTSEFPVEKMMRDAKATQIIEGTNQIQRIQIAKGLIKMY